MSRSRHSFPFALLLVLAASALTPAVRAQTPSARFAFADTTLLRDTLDLHFDQLFPLADSLRLAPDSLRAYSIRYRLPLERLVFLSDSMGTPVDSVGALFAREQFNPLARRTERLTAFSYESTYSPTRQSSAWGNTATCDLVRGPVTLHNVTSIQISRIREGNDFVFLRAKNSSTETGWKLTPDLSVGARVNLQRNESDQLGSPRASNNSDFQGSMHSRFRLARELGGELNAFGGPFNQPTNSLSSGSKQGFGTQVDGHIQYSRTGPLTFDARGTTNLRIGHATIVDQARFPTHDITWDSQGNVNLFPAGPASVRLSYTLAGDQIERASSFTQITPSPGGSGNDTTVVNSLLREPSGTTGLEIATQLTAGGSASLTITGNINRSTRLLASERKEGIVIDRTVGSGAGINVSGQVNWRAWSLDGRYSDTEPTEDSPREGAVNVPQENGTRIAVPVRYRERSRNHSRSLDGQLARSLSRHVTVRARGSIGLTTNRYEVTDDAYLDQTGGVPVDPGDPSDYYRQSYRLEGTYTPSATLSSTLALEVGRVTSLQLSADRSIGNKEDRLYRTEWVWTYRLMRGLTANQRNQINATYTRNIYVPKNNRLALSYSSITTLNATLTRHLSADLTHNAIYSPNGGYARAADGIEYFSVSDDSHDYTLNGRLNYSPAPGFTLTLNPIYQANTRDDRSSGTAVPTSVRRHLGMSAGASLNVRLGTSASLSGSISRIFDARRDISYSAGVPSSYPSSASDYWNGALQFSWSL